MPACAVVGWVYAVLFDPEDRFETDTDEERNGESGTEISIEIDRTIGQRGYTIPAGRIRPRASEEPPIRTNAVAETLDRSPAIVTETFQRLDREGLVTYESYKGVTLTDVGRERAAELHEAYVTVSWFLERSGAQRPRNGGDESGRTRESDSRPAPRGHVAH